ncbi:very short patch repair endonuclease [Paracoccus alkanivorans]|uniref:Very short patch repair endonuclease n=1 Tax=Paracoccus alkanivorans TaxID=2116655 RepID=A0A3M0MFX3_9RHOB|nr:very short patch repair endonuclease [Paracoccus alkanivorans]RMC36591.1 DNA mismatch endonuclease Vsr [Paracoccus alkanivorans]
MADIVDAATRSRMMSEIRGKNTRPELLLRKALHRAGFRFRLHDATLPGKPDIVLPKYRVVIFVHGCFWHRHEGCHWCSVPGSNADFWSKKFEKNVERDRRHVTQLKQAGWRVGTVWECALRSNSTSAVESISDWIRSGEPRFETGIVRSSDR